MMKRRSVSSGGGVDGGGVAAVRLVDPLFEFDAPQLFVDLTLPPKFHSFGSSDALYQPPHDPWFDQVHVAHSKPSYELAQEEAAVQQKNHGAEYGGSGNSASGNGGSKRRQSGSGGGSGAFRAKSAGALNQSAALEKENRLTGPQRRANVAPALSTLSSSAGGGGGLSNGANANAGGNASKQQTRAAALSGGSSSTAGANAAGPTVSGLPARLRRKSAGGVNGGAVASVEQEPANVRRMRAPIKTTTAAAVRTDLVATTYEPVAVDSSAARKRVSTNVQRERSGAATPSATKAGSSSSSRSSAASRSRFMAPTASSRMAVAQKQMPSGTGDASRNAKAKSAPRRPGTSTAKNGDSDLHDLQELLARHNKKFKSTHTYQPPQHSVRDVRLWEKQTQQSYYTLSPEDRVTANTEIAQLVKAKEEAANSNSH